MKAPHSLLSTQSTLMPSSKTPPARTVRTPLVAMLVALTAGLPAHSQQADTTLRHDILEFAIEGNTVLSQAAIERAVYPYMGPQRTVADAEGARAALQKAYEDAGYMSVDVQMPNQDRAGGVVRLVIVEGRVDRLLVTGNQHYLRSQIREELPALAPGSVPNFNEMQDQLAALQRAGDRQLTPLLRPGREVGTMEVEVAVEDKLPLHGDIELNNSHSPDTRIGRLNAGIRYDNLFQRQHSVGLRWITAPAEPSEVDVLIATYGIPLAGGDQISLYAVHSNSNVTTAATAASANVVGRGDTVGLRYAVALARRGKWFHGLSLGFDYKNLDETTTLIGFDTTTKPLRYMPLAASYSASWTPDDDTRWSFGVSTVLGLRPLLERRVDCEGVPTDQFECRRVGAGGGFSVLRGDVELGQSLRAWTPALKGWELSARAQWQLTSQALVSGEQLTAGGSDSVRGYLDAEESGDQGLIGQVQLRTPDLLSRWSLPLRLHVLGFVDGAYLRVNDALPGQDDESWVGSTGLGLRVEFGGWSAFADWAVPLRAGTRTDKHDARAHAGLRYDF